MERSIKRVVTIVIKDLEDSKINFNMDFEPALEDHQTNSAALDLGLAILKLVKGYQ